MSPSMRSVGVAVCAVAGLVLAGMFLPGLQVGTASGSAPSDGVVKVTPLGSHDGEFCPLDRAMVFEDPDGTRILYDAGRTVAGPDDPRLGDIDLVLLSHVHGDHLGDVRIAAVNEGECGRPQFSVSTVPNSNTMDIVLAKEAAMGLGSEMPGFFAPKLGAMGGDPAKVMLARFGAERQVGGVTVATVPAIHSNGLAGDFIPGPLGESLKAAGLTAYLGEATGYILTFSNGLVVWLSGDTGISAEQETLVNGKYGAKLAVLNIGGTFTVGPTQAAFVVNQLVKPSAVIASHANEPATEGGVVRPGSKTETFIQQASMPVHVPLSGRTMAFDAQAACVEGC